MTAPVKLALTGVRKEFPVRGTRETFTALDDITLELRDGEFLVLVGPSGSGKSTLLDLLGGLSRPSAGQLLLDGTPIAGPGLDRGIVFQQYALLPWRTARTNIEFGLEAKGLRRRERRAIAEHYLELVGLAGFGDRYPHELSGGMKQRVAIARSLAFEPEVVAPPPAAGRPAVPLRALRTAGRLGWRISKPAIAIVAFLAVWEIAPRAGLIDDIFLPPFSTAVQAFAELVRSGQMWEHVSTSLARSLIGFTLALVTAIPAGVAIAWYRRVADFLNPILELFRNTAALALLPVFILILGIGETSKIALVVYASFFPILLNTITGVRTVEPLLIKSAVSLGFSPIRLFQKVVLPAAVPAIFTGVRMAASSSILVLIAAEMVGARAGLGYLITAAQQNFQIPDMYAGILAISLLGLAFNGALVALERRLSRWRAPADH
jgi:NitT/TauT family transport system permease protein